jgi:hypothetical protein
MENIPQIYDIASNFYLKIQNNVKNMHFALEENKSILKPLEETLKEFDDYIESLLLVVSYADLKVLNIEIDFIKNITMNKSLFFEFDLKNQQDLQEALNISKAILNRVPTFVKNAVVLDKANDAVAKVISPTNCQIIYDNLKRIANYLKYVDGNVAVSEDKMVKEALGTVITYFKNKYVKYAPSRKKEEEYNECNRKIQSNRKKL